MDDFDKSVAVSHLEEIRDICIRELKAIRESETVNLHYAASSLEHAGHQLRELAKSQAA
jgi:hypothetical protein